MNFALCPYFKRAGGGGGRTTKFYTYTKIMFIVYFKIKGISLLVL
jgi:hypothetical protein